MSSFARTARADGLRPLNRLFPPRSRGDDRRGALRLVLDELDVILRGGRQLLERRHAGRRRLPSLHHAVLRLVVVVRDGEGGERLPALAADVVAGADGDLVEIIEDVELRQRDLVEAVEHRRGAHDREVEPAGAARPAGDGAELVATPAEMLAVRVAFELRRERAAADARRVR